MILTILIFAHFFFALNSQGQWVPYNLNGILQQNLSKYSNNTNGTVFQNVVSTDTQIIPSFFLYLYIVLLVIYFAIFALNRSRRAFIGVAFLGVVTAIVMGGAGLVTPSIVGIAWGIFMVVTAIVMFIGD